MSMKILQTNIDTPNYCSILLIRLNLLYLRQMRFETSFCEEKT